MQLAIEVSILGMISSTDLNVRSFLLISRRLNFNVGYLMVSSSVHSYLPGVGGGGVLSFFVDT